MTTKRTPRARPLKARITPAAIEAYRRLRSWDGRCTCPKNAPYPGQVYDSSDPVCQARHRKYLAEMNIYETAKARCPACPARAVERKFLIEELQLRLKPWQSGVENFPEVVAALEAAAWEQTLKHHKS